MKVLIACEFSGIVREAFRARGHDAYSCDLLPSLKPSPRHIQGDVSLVLKQPWDLVIAHPPCTYLCNSGVRWFKTDPVGRQIKMIEACDFFLSCLAANSPRVAVENPIMHGYAKVRIERDRSGHSALDVWAWGDKGNLSLAERVTSIETDQDR